MATNVFECEVCCEDYDAADRKPICLSCGHTVCRSCLIGIVATRGTNCHKCKQSIRQPVDQLPVNYALIPSSPSSQNPVSETHPSSSVARCENHNSNLDYFCATCDDILCRKCCKQSHQQHKVEFICDIIDKDNLAARIVEELQTKIESKYQQLTNSLSASSNVSRSINAMKTFEEKIQEYSDTLFAEKISLTDDLQAWNYAGSKSIDEKHELFKRLHKTWKGNTPSFLDEKNSAGFAKMLDELIANAGQVQTLAEELKKPLKQCTAPIKSYDRRQELQAFLRYRAETRFINQSAKEFMKK
ncbi:B-box-type zinc finger [Trinorchestia longiramus]|nr:B-box-type zinc finger [Trinorchestia longiramus]